MSTVADLITGEAQRQGVDPALALEVANAESGLNPNVSDSSAGAIGVFQLEPATAAQLGVNPRDLTQNISGGIRYLAQMLAQFGSIPAALAAYNWGPGSLAAAIAKYGPAWINHLPAETANYIAKITRNLGQQYTATVTPSSVTNAVLDLLAPGGSTDAAGTPAVPVPIGGSLTGLLILTGLALGVYIVAEVVFHD